MSDKLRQVESLVTYHKGAGWNMPGLVAQAGYLDDMFPWLTIPDQLAVMPMPDRYHRSVDGIAMVPTLAALAEGAPKVPPSCGDPLLKAIYAGIEGAKRGLKSVGAKMQVHVAEFSTRALKGMLPMEPSDDPMWPFMMLTRRHGDFIGIPVQMGRRFGGYDVSWALQNLHDNRNVCHEFPLDPATAAIILTMNRMFNGRFHELTVNCPVVMYSPQFNGKYDDAPRWNCLPKADAMTLDWNWDRNRPRGEAGLGTWYQRQDSEHSHHPLNR